MCLHCCFSYRNVSKLKACLPPRITSMCVCEIWKKFNIIFNAHRLHRQQCSFINININEIQTKEILHSLAVVFFWGNESNKQVITLNRWKKWCIHEMCNVHKSLLMRSLLCHPHTSHILFFKWRIITSASWWLLLKWNMTNVMLF
jgi:hypothetical protein